jgi:hypothetical protein
MKLLSYDKRLHAMPSFAMWSTITQTHHPSQSAVGIDHMDSLVTNPSFGESPTHTPINQELIEIVTEDARTILSRTDVTCPELMTHLLRAELQKHSGRMLMMLGLPLLQQQRSEKGETTFSCETQVEANGDTTTIHFSLYTTVKFSATTIHLETLIGSLECEKSQEGWVAQPLWLCLGDDGETYVEDGSEADELDDDKQGDQSRMDAQDGATGATLQREEIITPVTAERSRPAGVSSFQEQLRVNQMQTGGAYEFLRRRRLAETASRPLTRRSTSLAFRRATDNENMARTALLNVMIRKRLEELENESSDGDSDEDSSIEVDVDVDAERIRDGDVQPI